MPNYDLNFVKTSTSERLLGVAFPMTDGVGGYVAQNENLRSLRDCINSGHDRLLKDTNLRNYR